MVLRFEWEKKCAKKLNSTTQLLYQLFKAKKRQNLKVLVSPIWKRRGLKRPVQWVKKSLYHTKLQNLWNNLVLFGEKNHKFLLFFTSLRGWLKLLFFCFSYSEKCVRTVGYYSKYSHGFFLSYPYLKTIVNNEEVGKSTGNNHGPFPYSFRKN